MLGFSAGIIVVAIIEDPCGESPPPPRNHHYLTAGTDEVSMGMVKRVLYTATGGSCRDPEAVS